MLNVSEGLESRGMIWFGIVCCVQMKGSVYQAKEAKFSPIINRRKKKEENNIIKFSITQYHTTMGRISWRRKPGGITTKQKHAANVRVKDAMCLDYGLEVRLKKQSEFSHVFGRIYYLYFIIKELSDFQEGKKVRDHQAQSLLLEMRIGDLIRGLWR